MTRALVVGAGISGLVAARRLRAAGVEVEVLEATDAPGGWLRTERISTPRGEVLVELGPDAILGEKPAARALAEELGLQARVVKTRSDRRGAFVVTRGELARIPEGWSLLAPTSARALLRSKVMSPGARVRALLEPLVPIRTGEDETLASFVRRRLGWESLERLAQPLASGIYGADPEGLGLAATMPRFLEMERSNGSVRRGIVERARRAPAESASGARYGMFFGFDGGMQVLTDALSRELGSAIRLRTPVRRIERHANELVVRLESGETRSANAVVVAVPGPGAAVLLEGCAPHAAAALGEIPHGSVATVTFVMRREDVSHPLDAYGFVVPAAERRRVLAATFASEKWPGRAPEGVVIIRAFVGAPDEETMDGRSDESLVRTARRELDQLLGLHGEPLATRVVRYTRAMPRYALGHPVRARAIDEMLASTPGLALAGNALFGVGIPDAIASGERAAKKILADLSTDARRVSG